MSQIYPPLTSSLAHIVTSAGRATVSLTIYIIAINGGHVVEADNAGKEIKTQKATVSKSQQWVVEWKGAGKSDEFALRNVATDAYLGAPKGVSGTYCITSAKQFWRAEPGHAPGSFWLKSLEFDDACLCNSGAKTTANSIVYMWKKDEGWVQSMLWYLSDVNEKSPFGHVGQN